MIPLPTILLILAAISVGATVITAIVAFRSEREARSTIFPIVREEETIRARRARVSIFVWLAITALFLGGWLATRLAIPPPSLLISEAEPTQPPGQASVVTALATETPPLEVVEPSATTMRIVTGEIRPPTDTPRPPATTRPLPSSTSTPEPPTVTPTPVPPTVTPTPVPPTATPTQTAVPPPATPTETQTPAPPTPTPTSLAEAAKFPTPAPRTPAPAEARMGPIQFGTDITPEIEAVNPGTVFADGIEAVYAVYPFSGMERGLDFAVVWYQNGVELVRDEGAWQFGDKARSYSFIVPRGPGLYKLELYVNDSVLATGLFEIR